MTYLHKQFSPTPRVEFIIGNVPIEFGNSWLKVGYPPLMTREFAATACGHGMVITGLDGKLTPETKAMLESVKRCMQSNGFKLVESESKNP